MEGKRRVLKKDLTACGKEVVSSLSTFVWKVLRCKALLRLGVVDKFQILKILRCQSNLHHLLLRLRIQFDRSTVRKGWDGRLGGLKQDD